MNILITGVGGPTPRSFAIALKKYGSLEGLQLIGTDSNPLSLGLYQNIFDKSYVIPLASADNYWNSIEQIVADENVDLAIILPELEVLEWSKRKQSSDLPCKALIPDFELVSCLIDKSKMTEILGPIGLVPKSITFLPSDKNIETLFSELGIPFWVRSATGSSGLGSLKISSEDELANWIQINPGVKKFLASSFLPGRNLACKLLYYDGRLLRSASAERVNYIMSKVAPSGITGNTSFGRLLNETSLVEKAKTAMDVIFDSTGAQKDGFFTIDFKEDKNGIPMITEINVRHVAFTQCFAAGGANFAEDTVKVLSEDPSFDHSYNEYTFEEGLIFLRDVDENPIIMLEKDLLNRE